MSISRDEVVKMAGLARLRFSEEELDQFVPQFREIIGYVDQLGRLDTEGVEPLYHALSASEQGDSLRDDDVQDSLTPQQALQNAPEASDGQFRVPKVIE